MKILSLILFLFTFNSWSQTELKIRVLFDQKEIRLNEKLISNNGDTFSISALKFYISDLQINREITTSSLQNRTYLIDLENPESLTLLSSQKTIKHLQFNLGIDSTTNVAGILEGALDPINGMYWAWNSGYINFKIQGESKLQGKFEYHLGGYLPPFQTVQNLEFDIDSNSLVAYIDFDLEKWLKLIGDKHSSMLMIPGKEAQEMSEQFNEVVSISLEK